MATLFVLGTAAASDVLGGSSGGADGGSSLVLLLGHTRLARGHDWTRGEEGDVSVVCCVF